SLLLFFFFFQAEDGIRDKLVTGVQTCALPILSMALNTTVPTRPKAAAPAMPSVLRATVHWAGRKATARPAANTMSASTPSRKPTVIGTSRDVARNATTATAVTPPGRAPPPLTVRKSERSDTTGAAVTDMLRCSSPMGSGG